MIVEPPPGALAPLLQSRDTVESSVLNYAERFFLPSFVFKWIRAEYIQPPKLYIYYFLHSIIVFSIGST